MQRTRFGIRRTTFGILAIGALAASGCGGGTQFANKPRPAVPINLAVYVNDSRVSLSPSSVNAGPIIFIVTNQGSHTESITIQPQGGTQTLGTTGPINPQSTAQVTVDFTGPGDYTLSTGKSGTTEAAQATGHNQSSIQPATLHIGRRRPSASNQLLQP